MKKDNKNRGERRRWRHKGVGEGTEERKKSRREDMRAKGSEERRKIKEKEQKNGEEKEEGDRQEHSSWCSGCHPVLLWCMSGGCFKLTSGGRLDIVGGCVTFALACNVEMELMAGNRGIVVRTVGGMSRTATPSISCRCGHRITQSLVYYLHTHVNM